ncbi:hypothetical protein [Bacillus sp. MRMR6]|uniref:hypothetical protein n=1 Tax=Bacillus sp. MRMR6 TaxID=1928617 RepID=UPI00095129E9|nr:hypothetical protein [Bacillus sp. MRMR6]OLS37827.1 hypothetical protein BTR25_15040 [Bacillus sp. MRMR6]
MKRKIAKILISILFIGISILSNLSVGHTAINSELGNFDEGSKFYQIYYNGVEEEIVINDNTTLTLTGWVDEESQGYVNGRIEIVTDTSMITKDITLNVSEEINELALSDFESMKYQITKSNSFGVEIVDLNTMNNLSNVVENQELTSNTTDNNQTVTVEISGEEYKKSTEATAELGADSLEESDESVQSISTSSVMYSTHVQDYGWQDIVANGALSGTKGVAKRLEAIKISGVPGISYRTHVQDYGWQDFVSDGKISGTTGAAKRLEAIEIKLIGDSANQYDIYYRVHSQDFGWLGWAKNGQPAGSAGLAKRLEAIEIRLVAKGGQAPGSVNNFFVIDPSVTYSTHIQDYGWQQFVEDGALSGTSGKAKRLEAIKVQLKNSPYPGKIVYSTHVQDYGWLSTVENGSVSGTSGKSKRLEAITINLTGEMADHFDIYYRVHIQDHGWLGWAKNGMNAGSQNQAKRLEAIEIKLVLKGQGEFVDRTKAFIRTSNLYLPNSLIQNNKLISHAMGEIDGHYYTNSLEAFQNSYYNKGSRVFEVDFELTLDGILVARHDWRLIYAEQLMQTPETLIDNMPWTYDYFMKQSINQKYTPLDIDGIIELLINYPDIFIVTDTKHTDPTKIIKQFSQIINSANYDPAILKRIIPQIYNQEMLKIVNSIYNFENIIYTLYVSPDNNEQVITFVKDNINQIKAVTMPTSRVNRIFVENLHSVNVFVYTHPIYNLVELVNFYEMGVDGFYSATISKEELDRNDIK